MRNDIDPNEVMTAARRVMKRLNYTRTQFNLNVDDTLVSVPGGDLAILVEAAVTFATNQAKLVQETQPSML